MFGIRLLLGAFLTLATLGVAASYWFFRPSAVTPDETASADSPLPTLDPKERSYIWDVEHHGNILVANGFKPLAAALLRGDAEGLSRQLAPSFVGRLLRDPREVRVESGVIHLVRQTPSETGPAEVDAAAFVRHLLGYRAQFGRKVQAKISSIRLTPVERYRVDGPWEGTCQLRMWGEKAPGEPAEVLAYLRYRVRRPDRGALERGGWLEAAEVTQSQVATARKYLLRDAARPVGPREASFDGLDEPSVSGLEAAARRGLRPQVLADNWRDKGKKPTTGGLYVCDFDRDGVLDVLVTDMNGYFLYKGLPGGTFRDVTAEVGLPPRHPGFGGPPLVAAFADLDGDGWEDLILGGQVYRNDHGRRFVYMPGCNLRLPANTTGLALADYDGDGRVDLYAYFAGRGQAASWLDGHSGSQDGNHLYRNLGGWRFEDVTAKSGTAGGRRSTFSAVWLDADNDGRPDLFVANEFGDGVLLVNRGDGTFREQSLVSGPRDFGTMGVAAGDIDNDGHIDLYTANMYSKAGTRIISNLRPDTYVDPVMAKIRSFVTGSQLHHNLGGLRFEQKGQEWQVADVGWAYGPALADLDNDGFLDVYATAGYISKSRTEPDG